ncbi:DUF5719 family protein [Intrasporangium sp. DVR]|uniref:DUF5719 family protein n=1 Tax=Intrasporangium sp. DVR TaxID=3127867 RepID=UPI00313A5756
MSPVPTILSRRPRLPRSWSRAGLVRAAVIAATATGLTVAGSTVDGTVRLARPSELAGLPQSSAGLVDSASLVCPGQQRVGTQGMRDVSGTVQVSTAGAPAAALAGIPSVGRVGSVGTVGPAGTGPGLVSLAGPGGQLLASTEQRFEPVTAPTTGQSHVIARGERGLAPGIAATQGWWHVGDDDRGLALTPCAEPTADVWLVGGGGGPSRTERVVIINPGANPVSVRVEVFGAEGPVAASDRAAVSVPPQSRISLSLDALAPDELRPAVHVVATGGVVSAVLSDAWIDGATARGVDDATAAAAPARDVLVPGVEAAAAGQGETILRIVNPGASEALVRATVLTAKGPRQPAELRAVRVGAGSTLDVPLALAGGENAVRLTADQPVSAAVFLDRRRPPRAGPDIDREGDFGWAPGLPAIQGTGGVVIPALVRPGATRTLHLAAGVAGGTVTTTIGAGADERQVTSELAPLTSVIVALGDADRVWVSTQSRQVRAAVTVTVVDRGVPYFAVVPIRSAPTTETAVPVRQVTS